MDRTCPLWKPATEETPRARGGPVSRAAGLCGEGHRSSIYPSPPVPGAGGLTVSQARTSESLPKKVEE